MYRSRSIKIRSFRVTILIIFVTICSVCTGYAVAEEQFNDLQIIISNPNPESNYRFNMDLLPISIEIADTISFFDHVDNVIPVVRRMYHDDFENFSRPNQDDMHDSSSLPTDGERPFQKGNLQSMMNRMTNYIVEGIQIDAFETYFYSILSLDLTEGKIISVNDSYSVIIGQEALDFFDASLNDTVSIEDEEYTIIGIFDDDLYNKYIFTKLNYTQEIYDLDSNEINTIFVYVEDSGFLEVAQQTISEQFPEYQVISFESIGSLPTPNSPQDILNSDQKEISENENAVESTPGFQLLLVIISMVFLTLFIKKWKRDGNER